MPPSGGRIRRTLANSARRGVVNKLPNKAQAVNWAAFMTGEVTAEQRDHSTHWTGWIPLEFFLTPLLGRGRIVHRRSIRPVRPRCPLYACESPPGVGSD